MKGLCTFSSYSLIISLLVINLTTISAFLKDDLLETVTDYLQTQYDIHGEKHYYIHNSEY